MARAAKQHQAAAKWRDAPLEASMAKNNMKKWHEENGSCRNNVQLAANSIEPMAKTVIKTMAQKYGCMRISATRCAYAHRAHQRIARALRTRARHRRASLRAAPRTLAAAHQQAA